MNRDLIPITEQNSVTVVSANYIRSPQGRSGTLAERAIRTERQGRRNGSRLTLNHFNACAKEPKRKSPTLNTCFPFPLSRRIDKERMTSFPLSLVINRRRLARHHHLDLVRSSCNSGAHIRAVLTGVVAWLLVLADQILCLSLNRGKIDSSRVSICRLYRIGRARGPVNSPNQVGCYQQGT